MITYREFKPTGFDSHIQIEDREDWIVAPIQRNRDTSSALSLSNWKSMIESLGGESDSVEIHRFGHWACGWFEIVLVSPDRSDEISELKNSLDSYPILDEDDYYREESELAYESFKSYGEEELIDLLGFDELPFSTDTMWDLYLKAAAYCSWSYEDSNEGVRLNIEEVAKALLSGKAKDLLTAEIINYSRK